MGILPYIGVILFVWQLVSILQGSRTGNWKQEIVEIGVVYLIGIPMLGAGVSHVFFGPPTARSIGWEPGPFQFEVGWCDAAMGITALLAGSYSPEYWLAIIVASGIYRAGCGIGHVRDIVKKGNVAVNNTAILFQNFVVPAFLFAIWHAWA